MSGDVRIELAWFDHLVIVLYIVGILAHGLWVSRHREDADDYFLAGRALPWWLVGFSLYASNMSGSSFVGLMGASYAEGLVVFNYEWTAAVVLVFFAFFMLPHFLRSELWTIPQFLEERFDRRSRVAFSLFTILAVIFIDTAGALYAGGLVIATVFELALWQAVVALALVAGVYTVLGGLKAVVVTDTVQAILLMMGGAAIFFFALRELGGWDAAMAALDARGMGEADLIKAPDHHFLPWPGIGGVLLLGFYYWTLNQFVVQRALGAASLDQGRKGAIFAGLLKVPNLAIMILPGALAVLLYPGLDNPDLVFPTLAFDLLPVGFRGLILTATLAAIMSSLDSALNAASTLVTMDFVKESRPATSDDALVLVGRSVTVGVMVVAAVYAPMIASFANLFEYFQSVLAYVTPPMVAVYLMGIFWRRANRHGAFWTLVGALVMGVPLFITKEVTGAWAAWGLPDLHYTYMALLTFFGGCATLAAISLLTPAPDAAHVARTTFTRESWERDVASVEGPWWRDFRVQSAGLLALVVGLIVWFR
ncbi:MAG: sodium:solute symporter [Gemmatimonadetes bacterium]|nr:sodium:solute symporter [Gemmatimonadota bacterium]